jgi:hypothetical protein
MLVLDAYDIYAYTMSSQPDGFNGRVLYAQDKPRYPKAWEDLTHA